METGNAGLESDKELDRELIGDFIASLTLRPNSVAVYRKSLAYFFDYLAQKEIVRPESGDIAAYQEALSSSGRKERTVALYLAAIRTFFRWTESEGLYPNIMEGLQRPEFDRSVTRKTLTAAQLRSVMDGIDRDTLQGLRDYAVLAVLVMGGLSVGEVSRAKVGDVETSPGGTVLHIRDREGRRGDRAKLPARVVAALSKYLEARGASGPEAPLFAGLSNRTLGKGRHMSAGSINRIVKDAFRGAGYDDALLSAQSLKFTAIKLAFQGGEGLEDVQRFARHKQIRTTDSYRERNARGQDPACEDRVASGVFRREDA